jgi:hypothetical protein
MRSSEKMLTTVENWARRDGLETTPSPTGGDYVAGGVVAA